MPIPLIPCCTDEQVSKLILLGFGTTPIPDNIPVASALKWLRDKKKIIITPYASCFEKEYSFYCVDYNKYDYKEHNYYIVERGKFKTYERAESTGLDFAIDHLLK